MTDTCIERKVTYTDREINERDRQTDACICLQKMTEERERERERESGRERAEGREMRVLICKLI